MAGRGWGDCVSKERDFEVFGTGAWGGGVGGGGGGRKRGILSSRKALPERVRN